MPPSTTRKGDTMTYLWGAQRWHGRLLKTFNSFPRITKRCYTIYGIKSVKSSQNFHEFLFANMVTIQPLTQMIAQISYQKLSQTLLTSSLKDSKNVILGLNGSGGSGSGSLNTI